MLEYLGFQLEADETERSVRGAVSAKETTGDLGGNFQLNKSIAQA